MEKKKHKYKDPELPSRFKFYVSSSLMDRIFASLREGREEVNRRRRGLFNASNIAGEEDEN